MPPPTQGTPLFPLLDSACSMAETASVLLTASRSAIPSASWSQPAWPPAMSAMRLAMARQVIFERSKSRRACRMPLVSRLYRPGSARWMIRAGSEATALVAFWITLLMIVWKPLVMPLSWFCSVVVMLMSPQIRLLFQPTPTPMLCMLPAPPIDTARPPPML